MQDHKDGLGGANIGAVLRRISDRIDRDANRVYARLGVTFEQRWMGVLDLLARQGPMSVKDLARDLRISHPSVSQTRSSLLLAGFVAERGDPADGRRRALYLTPEGQALVETLQPLWAALDQVGRALNAEAGDAVSVLAGLEAAMDRRSIQDRVADALALTEGAAR
ncbi:MAG: MarR family transcriptional regulator [Caulobacterales bacterium]|nr:MarR family transcriptional regulator [Caulobacterales bacterium]